MTTRVVVADDQVLVRAGLKMVLEAEADIEVVGEAADGEQVLEVARRTQPDVVLMDIRMPVLDGLEASRRLLARADPPKVLVLTTFDEEEYLYEALRAGTCGFLLKVSPPEQLIGAVRTVAAGNALIDPAVTRRVIAAFGRRVAAKPPPRELEELTARELEVLQLLARGLSNQEIAAELIVGDATVKTHVARVLMKLGLRDRVQAVVFAYEHGIVEPAAMPVPDAVAYVRAALPPPPARVLEIGAGDGELAARAARRRLRRDRDRPEGRATRRAAGRARRTSTRRRARSTPRSRCVSLHHVVPLGSSLRRLSEVLRHGARLVVDEFDVDAYDERAAVWWLEHAGDDARRPPTTSPRCASTCTRWPTSARSSRAWFDVGEPVPGAYLYRWHIDPGAARRGGAADRRGRAARGRHALHRDRAVSASPAGARPRRRACTRARSAGRWRPRRRA